MSKVYLVGAGPGDEGLITVKGLRLIQKADYIIYDRLINYNLLNEKKSDAKLFYVGKEGMKSSWKQEEINNLLLKCAREEGKITLRLKGGDPLVFGRGSEEALFLKEHGIDSEIVPGISSSIGGLIYGGVPTTHREVSRSFHVFTGHTMDGPAELDWENLAKMEGTLIFLMAMSNIETIANKLIAAGKNPDTKAAFIYKATRSDQRRFITTLKDAYECKCNNDIKNPSVFVIGDVVQFADDIDFFAGRPLKDRTFILLRKKEFNQDFKDFLIDNKAEFLELETIKYTPIHDDTFDKALKNIEAYKYLILTSRNAVEFFFKRALELGIDFRRFYNIKIASIGQKTMKDIETYGFKADYVSEKYTSDEMIKNITSKFEKGAKVLYPHSDKAKGNIRAALSDYDVDAFEIYKNSDEAYEKMYLEDKVYDIFFFSSSEAISFNKFYPELMSKARIYSIGPYTTKSIEALGYKVYKEAKVHDSEGMIDLVKEEINNEK